MLSVRCLPLVGSLVMLSAVSVCLASPLPSPDGQHDSLTASPSLRVDVHHLAENSHSGMVGLQSLQGVTDITDVDNTVAAVDEEPTRQLSPTTQSFLATLGTALGPIVGAIVGPLLTNIGQNLSSGSGAQAIAQLQQAAQAAVVAQQQQQQGLQGVQGGVAVAAAAAVDTIGTPSLSTSTPSSSSQTSTSRPVRPTRPGRPNNGRPSRPGTPTRPAAPTGPARPSTESKPPRQTFASFVLDVPGKGPVLLLMTSNVSEAEQSAAIQQAQQQAAQLFAENGQSWPIGAVASLVGSSTQSPQVTKPTSVGPLPVRPITVTPSPLPSYHSLAYSNEDDLQQSKEELAVVDDDVSEHMLEKFVRSTGETSREDDDFSSQSFFERLFPEMIR